MVAGRQTRVEEDGFGVLGGVGAEGRPGSDRLDQVQFGDAGGFGQEVFVGEATTG